MGLGRMKAIPPNPRSQKQKTNLNLCVLTWIEEEIITAFYLNKISQEIYE